jgi:hypothetical protein
VPNAAPAEWLTEFDEVVLMVYGDPGGPLVGESAAAILRRLDDERLWRSLPPGRGSASARDIRAEGRGGAPGNPRRGHCRIRGAS